MKTLQRNAQAVFGRKQRNPQQRRGSLVRCGPWRDGHKHHGRDNFHLLDRDRRSGGRYVMGMSRSSHRPGTCRPERTPSDMTIRPDIRAGATGAVSRCRLANKIMPSPPRPAPWQPAGRRVGQWLSETASSPHHNVVRPFGAAVAARSINPLMLRPHQRAKQEHPRQRIAVGDTGRCVLASANTTIFRGEKSR